MGETRGTLIIPVENQVRELDPKLLLACIAARRGFASFLGSRREMEFRIWSFPRSVYLGKSMTIRGLLLFLLARRFGHEIVTWDEEALVHLPPDVYYSRRISPAALRCVSHLFAWGEDNADLWRQYPHLPPGLPIHATGNPRNDMLRAELRPFHAEEVERIRGEHGPFVLVNTNFNHVNAFFPGLNLFVPTKKAGQKPRFGRGARGMPLEYAEGLRDHKQAIFEAFLHMVPELERAFPGHRIVVRPHPTESQEVYRELASRCERVRVTNEGNVVPWLLAADALIHNGCTTGVEAYVLGKPALSYRARVDDRYDRGFYVLPNLLSHECFSLEEVKERLAQIFRGGLGPASGAERDAVAKRYLSGLEGAFACERIVDVVERIAEGALAPENVTAPRRAERAFLAGAMRLADRVKSYLPGGHNRPAFQKHRYPGIPLDRLREKIRRFEEILGPGEAIGAEEVRPGTFRVACRARGTSGA